MVCDPRRSRYRRSAEPDESNVLKTGVIHEQKSKALEPEVIDFWGFLA